MNITLCLIALLLTLIIELAVAFFLGYKTKKILISIICINLITHPLFCYFLWINFNINLIPINYFSITVLEILITLIESLLLLLALKQKYLTMLKLSFAMNFMSYIVGLILF